MSDTSSLRGRVAFISGASRGIGKAIALRLAREGVAVAVVAKSVQDDPRLGGTVYSTVEEIEAAGGKALAIPCDIRDEAAVAAAVEKAAVHFGKVDILVNNASAIHLADTESTPAKRFDLMFGINVRGTFLVTQHCLPHLKRAGGGHILTLSPPIDLSPDWFEKHTAYTASKYAMSMLTLGWGAELRDDGIGAASLWPRTTIATAAVQNLLGGDYLSARSRKPEIVADAAALILAKPAKEVAGNFFLDEDVLREAGTVDFEDYAMTPGGPLQTDLFLR
jgi:citronellol/citronellal dehydrogenase